MIAANIDYLVLGCSHYPYLIPQIKKILPKEIKIIDSGEAVARQTKNVLSERNGLNDEKNKGKAIFYTNSNPKVLKDILNNKYDVISKDF
jgi:glutamate racemase